jgi:Zn-dependent peptidase ImmA (M78 family)/transcriptional regulator with XRE-family HTH domain
MGTLGNTLRARRDAFGLSPRDVSEISGVPVSDIEKAERDERRPNADELARLARALAADPAALWRGDSGVDDPRRGTVRFLAGPGLAGLSPLDRRLLSMATEVGRICGHLRRVLRSPDSPVTAARTITPIDPSLEPWRHGYRLGEQAREQLSPAQTAIPAFQALLESWGVHVAFVQFDSEDIIASSLCEPDAIPVILLNKRLGRISYPLARRSVLAHELGHILHDATPKNILSVASRRSQEGEPWEQRANGFAPSFLAPGAWVRLDAAEPAEIVAELASTWLLSWEGAAWHAKNLELVTPSEAERLKKAPRGWVAPEVHESVLRTPPEMFGVEVEPTDLVSGYASELVLQAAAEGELSRGRAAEILSIR